MGDIAAEAGISKSMLFYYFGSKRNLYLFLVEFCGKRMTAEMQKGFIDPETDFFERMRKMTRAKAAVMGKYPAMVSFIKQMYYETDEEVTGAIKEMISGGAGARDKWLFEGTDMEKFKDPNAPKYLEKFMRWAGEGCLNDRQIAEPEYMDNIMKEFDECLDMLKKNFYK
jgi:AcrR family transcriptional regulator